MRIRIATAGAALLALGFATMTLARQGDGPKSPNQSKADLRHQVAGLRAEVEWLQLEHEVDVAVVKDLINGLRASEIQESVEAVSRPMIEDLKKEVGEVDALAGLPFLKGTLERLGINPEDQARKQALVDKTAAKALVKLVDPIRAKFLARATELNEKKLDLADLERRLSVAP